jgi:hypothetical protein
MKIHLSKKLIKPILAKGTLDEYMSDVIKGMKLGCRGFGYPYRCEVLRSWAWRVTYKWSYER